MKTLDEVIKANECCDHGEPDSRCEDCPYNGLGACCLERESDALYYLKMFRSDMQMYAENQKHWETELMQKIKDFGDAKERYIARLKELDIGTLNDPLNWEQLKQMEGKPVWICTNYGLCHWGIIDDVYDDEIYIDGEDYNKKDMVTEWQAYRKERS